MPSREELSLLQELPLNVKIKKTQQRIREWVNRFGVDGCYVSFSGGKDSTVLVHLVKELYPKVPVVFINTGLEYDSVREKGIELADEVIRPQKSFLQIITEYGYPLISKEVSQCIEEARRGYQYRIDRFEGKQLDKNGNKSHYNMEKWHFLLDAPFRISHLCCNHIKKNPSKFYEKQTHRTPFIGTLAEESRLRKQKWLKVGCNAFDDKRPMSTPLSFWTEQDILNYIKQNQIDIASIYKDIVYVDDDGMEYDNELFNDSMQLQTTGVNRTGCVYCMFGITQELDKFINLKKEEPVKYDYVMRGGKFDEQGMWIPDKGLGYKFVIDWLNEHGNLNIRY